MHQPSGYTLGSPLHIGPATEVQLATRNLDRKPVVLKTYARDSVEAETSKLERERDALTRAAGPGVPGVLDLIWDQGSPILVMEYVQGVTLASWVKRSTPEPSEYLSIAIQLAQVLERVHGLHMVHRDVTPHNIIVDPESLCAYLIDFELARTIGSKLASNLQTQLSSVTGMAGTMRFMAPEQSGRMNRGVDARSDLYSLGATFFFAITGEPVFDLSDRMALIHAHMARMPRSPRELRTNTPEAISRSILKLLAKDPDDRYQSATSLISDLRFCLDQLESKGEIANDFLPGAGDEQSRVTFSSTLFERERETSLLHEAYAAASNGELQLWMVAGELGTGKTVLVESLQAEVARTNGYFVRGKFDAYTGRPYLGLTSALSSFCEQVLLESDQRLAQLREALLATVGNLIPALAELVPDVRFIVGETVPLIPLGPAETRSRFSLAFQRFLRACATPERPLLLFLDDMQHCDHESHFVLVDTVSQCKSPSALIVCASRVEGGGGPDPTRDIPMELQSRGRHVDTIELGPLSIPGSRAMISAALGGSIEDASHELAEIVHRKTGGNPLLVQQYVEQLHLSGLLVIKPDKTWEFDRREVAACEAPDGAVAFLTRRISQLGPEAARLLALASCTGREFSTELMSELGGGSEESELVPALQELSQAGLIAPCRAGFSFTHERIREAAQASVGEEKRATLHYQTAQLLLASTPPDRLPERAIEIAEHFNRGLAHLSAEVRLDVVRINHTAGKQHLAAGAAQSASIHFGKAIELLREADWTNERALCLALHLDCAESVLQLGDLDGSLELLSAVEPLAASPLEIAQIAVKRLQVYGISRRPEDTIRYMLSVLRRLGVRWPLFPSRLRAMLSLRWILWLLREREEHEALKPASRVDPGWLAPLLIIAQGGGVLIRHSTYLTTLATCFVLRTYHRHGYIGRLPFTLASMASWLNVILGDSRAARRFADRALELNQRSADPIFGPRTEMQLFGIIYPWLMPRKQPLARLDDVVENLSEVGDVEYAYYTRFLQISYLALAGDSVAQTSARLSGLMESVRAHAMNLPEPEFCQRAHRHLLDPTTSTEIESELRALNRWREANPGWADMFATTFWLLVLCVHGRHDLAFSLSRPLEELVRSTPFVHVADHTFYRGLAAAELATHARGFERKGYRRTLNRAARWIRRICETGPDFLHMRLILEAELARLEGAHEAAVRLLMRAAMRAKDQDFVHHAALAYERAACMLLAKRRDTQAATMLQHAARCYNEWGAIHKAKLLRRQLLQ